MKYTIEYCPPFKSLWSEQPEWEVTCLVIYRPRGENTSASKASGSYQMFWPENPWDALDKINLLVDF